MAALASLVDKVVLVFGGAGTIGSGAVKSFLKAGAKVVVPARSAERAELLTAELQHPNILTVIANPEDPEGAKDILKFLEEKTGGQLDHVVSSLGSGVWGTPVVEQSQPVEKLDLALAPVRAHYYCANTLLPFIADKPGTSYTFITGGAAFVYIPGAGFTTISNAAQVGLSIAARGETASKLVRVNEVCLTFLVHKGDANNIKMGELIAGVAAGKTKGEAIRVTEDNIDKLISEHSALST